MPQPALLFHPYPHDTVLIDPTAEQLSAEIVQAVLVANAQARVRTVTPMDLADVLSTPSGRRESNEAGSRGRTAGTQSVLGCAWVTGRDGRKHVRILGGRIFTRASVWGAQRRAEQTRDEELVYPVLLTRIAALWGHDTAVAGILARAAGMHATERKDVYFVLSDRLEDLGAGEDGRLLRAGGLESNDTRPAPVPAEGP